MTEIHGWATHGPRQKLEPFSYEPGPLGPEEVEIAVEYCGLCHSDLSIINDEWGMSQYPVIPGHEVAGKVVALGDHAKGLHIGQRVGVGWNAGSCMHCHECMTGNHNLCAEAMPTIVGHQGGFADRVRAHWAWTIPLPDTLDLSSAGPLLCGGITVFSPLLTFGVKPTDRVGVIGIGGLGHMGLGFANAWGCEVTAFTSHASKAEEARGFGAHHVVSSRDSEAMRNIAGSLDMLIVTVNAPLDWAALLKTLKPNGRLHIVGAVLEPMPIPAIDLIFGQKSVSGSPNGDPMKIATMLEFAARHGIAPQVEHFPMSQVNEALEHLAAGKARYRIVLDPDFA
ncbi:MULTISPECIES: NADPH-dependent aldehyde reductase Ahr [Methylobacter]|jgi:alcohol/geraniol dehydrogenase (NADP+)|uniref:NADPH-dependent aldehyde reductase Ahr n=1 Tax=Methylobacter TaxID=429 RepID=UPI00036473BF|nr:MULTISPECIES: NAD(P)-dependent alcohol dehydrogenase [Methylobacter]